MPEQSVFSADDVALSWAKKHFPVNHQELIADHPWSKVFRLQEQDEVSYLKLIPENDKAVIDKNAVINKHFKDATPQIKAFDKKLGVMVIREHISVPLGTVSSEYQLKNLLKTYATIQSQAVDIKELQQELHTINITELLDDLFNFLNPEKELKHGVSADYFMDDAREAYGYYVALSSRREYLEAYLANTSNLPITLNHCDLHTDNVSETEEGNILIYDWDDAVMGPVGMSLHRLMQGCSNVAKLLDSSQPIEPTQEAHQRVLQSYIDTLVKQGYADAASIEEALPASACLGAMQSIVSYQKYPQDDYFYKKDISDIIRGRIEDIVHLCDLLALRNRKDTLYFANNYLENNAPWRAIYLLDEYAKQHPSDIGINHFLAQVEMQSGRWNCATNTLQRILDVNPDDVEACKNRGIALVKDGQSDLALKELELALQSNPAQPEAVDYLNKAAEIMHWKDRAKVPHLAPSLALSEQECEINAVSEEKLRLAIDFYREYGVTVVENAFPRELIEDISKIVFNKYDDYFEDRKYEDNLVLGDKRRMVTLSIEGALNSPRLYGSQMLTGMLSNLLDTDYVMGGLNAVVSLPGSRDQGLHKDYSPLFKNEADKETHVTPSFAVAMLIPLIDIKREHGTTSFRKGSHLVPEQMPFDMPTQDPVLKMGDCVVFDYRTAHEGLANISDEVRPLLCVIHHRIWFRDALNYNQQKDVMITKEELEKVPDEYKYLFKWVH